LEGEIEIEKRVIVWAHHKHRGQVQNTTTETRCEQIGREHVTEQEHERGGTHILAHKLFHSCRKQFHGDDIRAGEKIGMLYLGTEIIER
jgi:hypothetical protein